MMNTGTKARRHEGTKGRLGTILSLLLSILFCLTPSLLAGDSSAPPKDAVWTIYCRSFSGEMRAAEAKRCRDLMEKQSGMKDWWVVHQQDASTLYYGYYRSNQKNAEDGKDRKDAERLFSDNLRIRALKDADENAYFPFSLPVQIPQPGDEGPPEWNLLNTPKTDYWTILIGLYRDHPDRKKAAVDAVKQLRKDGKEAYYFHGDTTSTVCIGAWPREALSQPEKLDKEGYVAPDSETEIWFTTRPLKKTDRRDFLTPDGKKIHFVCPEVEIRDKTLEAAKDENPYFYTNGVVLGKTMKDSKTKKEEIYPDASAFLVIPRKQAAMDASPIASPPPAVMERMAPPQPKSSDRKLKSLDD
jgi:hypothetical protein